MTEREVSSMMHLLVDFLKRPGVLNNETVYARLESMSNKLSKWNWALYGDAIQADQIMTLYRDILRRIFFPGEEFDSGSDSPVRKIGIPLLFQIPASSSAASSSAASSSAASRSVVRDKTAAAIKLAMAVIRIDREGSSSSNPEGAAFRELQEGWEQFWAAQATEDIMAGYQSLDDRLSSEGAASDLGGLLGPLRATLIRLIQERNNPSSSSLSSSSSSSSLATAATGATGATGATRYVLVTELLNVRQRNLLLKLPVYFDFRLFLNHYFKWFYIFKLFFCYTFNTFKAFFGQSYMSLVDNVNVYIKKNN